MNQMTSLVLKALTHYRTESKAKDESEGKDVPVYKSKRRLLASYQYTWKVLIIN